MTSNEAAASQRNSEDWDFASVARQRLRDVCAARRAVRLGRWIGGLGVVAALLLAASSAHADSQVVVLSEIGTDLGRLESTGKIDDLRFTVDLQGDAPTGFYVWATLDSAHRRQRTNEGYWLKWNGDLESLIDNQFPVVDGKVQFKIIDETLTEHINGIDINIGYRTGGVMKYGKFAIAPSGGGQ